MLNDHASSATVARTRRTNTVSTLHIDNFQERGPCAPPD